MPANSADGTRDTSQTHRRSLDAKNLIFAYSHRIDTLLLKMDFVLLGARFYLPNREQMDKKVILIFINNILYYLIFRVIEYGVEIRRGLLICPKIL